MFFYFLHNFFILPLVEGFIFPLFVVCFSPENNSMRSDLTSYYTYETDVTYDELGPDRLLSRRGLAKILQEAASVASDERGFGMKDIPRTGVFWVLAAWRLELLERPPWRSRLAVQTWPRAMSGFQSERDFLVYHGDTLIARASPRWLLVNAATGRVGRVTEAIRSVYDLDDRVLFDTPVPSNGKSPDGTPVTFAATIGRREIDTNGHVNNIHYLEFALEALPEEVFRNLPHTVDITFRRQILLGTHIRCLYSLTEDGKHQVEIQSGEAGQVVRHAFVWFY